MSLVTGFFTFPIGFAREMYKQACYELVLTLSDSSKSIPKSDPKYHEILQGLSAPVKDMKDRLQPFLEKVGVRTDIQFIEQVNPGFCLTCGTNVFTNSDAVIMTAPGLQQHVKACSWVIKHEISHIKHNDLFTMYCVPFICQLAASIFGMNHLSFVGTVALSYTVGMVTFSLFSQWREAKADDFAITNSSISELQGGKCFLEAVQRRDIAQRTSMPWGEFLISDHGNNRLDIMHPSITSRIHKIEKAIHDRGGESTLSLEAQQTQRIRLVSSLQDTLARNAQALSHARRT